MILTRKAVNRALSHTHHMPCANRGIFSCGAGRLCPLPMSRIVEAAVADALLTAPGWARVGLTTPIAWMREDAARELARIILSQIE